MRFSRRLVRRAAKIFGLIALLILLFGSVEYLNTTIYEFRPAKPFTGKNWYNPYQRLDSIKIRANFHAHSKAWSGLSNGSGSPAEIRRAYSDSGYRVRAISNYFHIDTTGKANDPLYVPAYEHGMNIQKTHCLVINSGGVSYTDYLLYQTTSHQQNVIESIKRKGGIVALAHPDFLFARTLSDMRKLEHYDLVEVLNHFRFSDEHWDAALSSGRLAFLVADDDAHGLEKGQIFRAWTEIFVNMPDKKHVLNSLINGRAVGVATIYQKSPVQNGFVSCQLSNDTISVQFRNRADSILFIGQNGRIRKAVFGTDRGQYVLQPDDTYIRIKSINAETHVYLNPILRYGSELPFASKMFPKQQTLLTWLARAFAFILVLFFVYLLFRLWKWKIPKA